jgi:hypothetical protein
MHLRILWTLIFCAMLAGCSGTTITTGSLAGASPTATTTPSLPAMKSLAAVDWKNFTYPHGCFDSSTSPVTVANGTGSDKGWHLSIDTPVYGAITGTVLSEAIIPFNCTSADTMGVHVFVFTGTADHPTLMGRLPADSESFPKLSDVNPSTITTNSANHTVTFSGKGYAQNDGHCCPSLSVTNTYQWDGSRFHLVHQDQKPVATTTNCGTITETLQGITPAQYQSIVSCFASFFQTCHAGSINYSESGIDSTHDYAFAIVTGQQHCAVSGSDHFHSASGSTPTDVTRTFQCTKLAVNGGKAQISGCNSPQEPPYINVPS